MELNKIAKDVSIAQMSKAKYKIIKLCIIWEANKKDRQLLNYTSLCFRGRELCFYYVQSFHTLELDMVLLLFQWMTIKMQNVNQILKAAHP